MFSKKTLIFLLIFNSLLVFFLYRNSFSSYFFQDDWFTLKISSVQNIGDFLNFFVPRTDVIYYRPLGMQVYFFILQLLFGLKSFPFHLTAFITHIVNSVLIFLIASFFTKNKIQSAFISILYASSAVHFTPFYWASTYPFILGPGLVFLSFYSFLMYQRSGNNRWLTFSVISYILGIFTNEMSVVFPVLVFLYAVLFSTKRVKNTIVFFVISLIFALRFIFFHPPTVGTYAFVINKTILNNLVGFGMWTFNWPEEMKAQMMSFGYFNPLFVSEFYYYYIRFIVTFGMLVFCLFVFPLAILFIKKTKNNSFIKIITFGILWYLVGLLPILFFPVHTFSYYLPISLFGFLILSTSLAFNAVRSSRLRILLSLIILSVWVISSETSIDFNEKVYWAPSRARLSKSITTNALEEKRLNPETIIFYVSPSSESKLALNNQDALQVFFRNLRIRTLYSSPPVLPL